MLRKIPIATKVPSLARRTLSPLLPGCSSLCYNFSQLVYKPLLPLTQNYNTLYIYPAYSQGETLRPHSLLIYLIPSALLFTNNMLTQWTVYNSTGLAALFLGTMFLRWNIRNALGNVIHCIQTDPQLRYVYLTLPASAINLSLSKYFQVFDPERNQLRKNYHPLQQKYPDIKLTIDMMEFLSQNATISQQRGGFKVLKKFRKIQNRITRFKIPMNLVNFKMIINVQEEPEFTRDKQRLSQKQMMKKYEKQNILATLNVPQQYTKISKQNKIAFNLPAPLNENKRYHDYIMAMALGYKIDTRDNKQQQDVKYSQDGRDILFPPQKQPQKQHNNFEDSKKQNTESQTQNEAPNRTDEKK